VKQRGAQHDATKNSITAPCCELLVACLQGTSILLVLQVKYFAFVDVVLQIYSRCFSNKCFDTFYNLFSPKKIACTR
jgi:hypothetical protein